MAVEGVGAFRNPGIVGVFASGGIKFDGEYIGTGSSGNDTVQIICRRVTCRKCESITGRFVGSGFELISSRNRRIRQQDPFDLLPERRDLKERYFARPIPGYGDSLY